MDYLFRLADGRRLALWNERNQIVRQLSGGGGNRSQVTLRTDFLSDLSAVSVIGQIYFVYQNTSRRVMLHRPDGEEDQELFGETIESCRHSGLTLAEWRGNLYLVYIAWNPVREQYFLKLRKLADSSELVLARDIRMPLEFQVMNMNRELWIITSGQIWCLRTDENGQESVTEIKHELEKLAEQEAEWAAERERLSVENSAWKRKYELLENELNEVCGQKTNGEKKYRELREQLEKEKSGRKAESEHHEQEKKQWESERQTWLEKEIQWNAEKNAHRQDIQSAVTQYNELAEVARQLQKEGKKWRDKYIQEARKRKDRPVAAKGDGIIE